ncbi:Pimeloyl-ACP methyl ester carboxylesterase [Pedobacter westerhofensis]|uniref:Pimeloyl-ACP methyl ester carboxylesterase n=2 Tax=Pedobacter westerhofensis TaxID=425512 RepID=A0A521BRL4_9SPHI|nr:Pimeloyl-ACP methyl ester carboxylesterase [Pedobacter westerhofensis]
MFAMTVLSFTSFAQPNKKTKTIILVHGAWSDASAWQAVTPLLKAEGHEVIEVNLAGHGSDTTSFANINLNLYVESVKTAIGNRKNVILVGHSMAGLVISQVAEEIPGQIQKLIYLAAYLPQNGESLLALANTDADSHVSKYLQIDEKNGSAAIAKAGVTDVFAADAPAEVATYIADHIQPEPLAPLATPVKLTAANFGKVSKVYIYTVNDHTVGPKLQHIMVEKARVSKTYSLESSHTPFVSMPGKVADIIIKESK